MEGKRRGSGVWKKRMLRSLAGVLAVWGYMALAWLRLRRRLATAVWRGSAQMGWWWESDRIPTAFVFGFFTPRVYVPAGVEGETLRWVLLHERAHIKLGHHRYKAVYFLLAGLHWFNPMLWLSWVLLGRDLEVACDEKVLGSACGSPREYSAALLALACYILLGWNVQSPSTADISIEWMKVFPYLLVLVTALAGIHVMVVLTMGLLATGLIGIGMGYFSFMAWFQAMGSGMTGMGELIIVTLLAGGVLSIIRFNGGIAYIIGKITAHIHSRRGAEFSIAGLVSLANLCTANNTIAIITAGPIAKEISDKFHIPPKRSASILDTFSCLVQGVIPYGAQMLMAAGISQVSPLLVMKYLYYPLILGICSTLAIALAPGGTERRGKR